MRPAVVEPTGIERTFGQDEIIVSKTDLQGRITYANDVFLRVSAYEEREIIGRPHSVIRHPDMPRAVFKLLWDTLQGGDEMFAYVLRGVASRRAAPLQPGERAGGLHRAAPPVARRAGHDLRRVRLVADPDGSDHLTVRFRSTDAPAGTELEVARATMAEDARRLQGATDERRALAAKFEDTVMTICEHLSAAATELSASAVNWRSNPPST